MIYDLNAYREGCQKVRTQYNYQGCGLGLDVSVSRLSRDVLTSRLGQSAQRLGLVSVSDLCVSGLVSVSAQKVSASRLGSPTFSSRRDVSYRRACKTSVLRYALVRSLWLFILSNNVDRD